MHARNWPNRPRFSAIGLPQFSQGSGSASARRRARLLSAGFFLGDFLRVLAFGIGGACQEAAELSPFLHHRTAAFFANLVGGDFLRLQVLHVLGGFLQILLELLVELVERLRPRSSCLLRLRRVLLPFAPCTECRRFLRSASRAWSVTTVPSSVGRNLPWSFVDIFAILNRRQNRGVSGRTADALLFEHLHQRCFGKSRRRLGEVLPRVDVEQSAAFRPASAAAA